MFKRKVFFAAAGEKKCCMPRNFKRRGYDVNFGRGVLSGGTEKLSYDRPVDSGVGKLKIPTVERTLVANLKIK